jgi:hypothetical protein
VHDPPICIERLSAGVNSKNRSAPEWAARCAVSVGDIQGHGENEKFQ